MKLSQGNYLGTTWKVFCKNGKYYLSTFQQVSQLEAEKVMVKQREFKREILNMTAEELLDWINAEERVLEEEKFKYHLEEARVGLL